MDAPPRRRAAAETPVAVAWEGSGAARAVRFSDVPFVEVRVITDGADGDAARSFHANVRKVLPNAGRLLYACCTRTHLAS